MSTSNASSFSFGRRWRIILHVALAIVSFVALVVMVNYLSARHYKRFHWSSRTDVELTPRTLSLLRAMTNEVEITVFFDPDSVLHGPVTRLLEEYRAISPALKVTVVDMYRQPTAAQTIKARYKIDFGSDANFVIIDHAGKFRVIADQSLADFDYDYPTAQTYRKKYRSFRGELMFTSAIADVISPRQFKAYFLKGHNEHKPANSTPQDGYLQFSDLLAENNIQFAELELTRTGAIPEDCDLLIIAGPQSPLMPMETDRIEQYLNQGGRLLVGFNFQGARVLTGLERLLGQWGIVVGMNLVEDADYRIGNQSLFSTARYGMHPTVAPLVGIDLVTIYPRTIAEDKNGNPGQTGARVTELVYSGTNAVVLTKFEETGAVVRTGLEFRGEVPLAVAVEKGSLPGVSAQTGVTRIVVIGDSFMFGNEMLNQRANRDFANQVINWLVDRSELMPGIGPRPMQEYQLALLPGQLRAVRTILIAGLPLAALLLGLAVWLRRRS